MVCSNQSNLQQQACAETTVVKDNDGHTYRIPLEREEQFGVMMAAINAAEYQSDDWYDANDALDSEFHQYMFSGK